MTLANKALEGNVEASRVLLSHYQDKTEEMVEPGLFSAQKLKIVVVEGPEKLN